MVGDGFELQTIPHQCVQITKSSAVREWASGTVDPHDRQVKSSPQRRLIHLVADLRSSALHSVTEHQLECGIPAWVSLEALGGCQASSLGARMVPVALPQPLLHTHDRRAGLLPRSGRLVADQLAQVLPLGSQQLSNMQAQARTRERAGRQPLIPSCMRRIRWRSL